MEGNDRYDAETSSGRAIEGEEKGAGAARNQDSPRGKPERGREKMGGKAEIYEY